MMMEHRNAIGSSSAEVAQRRVVESYRDFSTITEQDARNLQGTGDMLGIFDHAAASSVHVFPEKMHYILLELENEGSRDIVSWLPHGRAFMVHSLKLFEEEILSKWFNMTKYTSFQRQMNLYGFRRVAKGVDKGAYYHELFSKGGSTCASISSAPRSRELQLVNVTLTAMIRTSTGCPQCRPQNLSL